MDEADFLRAVLADPTADAPVLIYADWLEEQADPAAIAKAEFLRLTATEPASARLRELAADLDPEWLAVVSSLAVENCGHAERESAGPAGLRYRRTVEVVCDLRWEELTATEAVGERYCDRCRHTVHYCSTIGDAREHVQKGNCVAIDLGIPRRENDLEAQRHWLGRPSEETLRAEEERMKIDPVSEKRERFRQRFQEP